MGAFMADFLSQAWPYAAAVLVVLGIVALVFLVIILYRASLTMKSVQSMAAEAEKEVTPALAKVNPMVDKAELMLDTVNLEMLRVDAILEDVEQISDVAGKAATTVDAVTSAPADAVTSIVDRIRGSIGSKRSNKGKQERLVYPIGSASAMTDGNPSGEAKDDPSGEIPAQEAACEAPSVEQEAPEAAPAVEETAGETTGKHSIKSDETTEQSA